MRLELNKATALTLRAGIVLGMALMLLGLCLYAVDGSETLLYAGLLVLIVSPNATGDGRGSRRCWCSSPP